MLIRKLSNRDSIFLDPGLPNSFPLPGKVVLINKSKEDSGIGFPLTIFVLWK
jgi:hypothetical protein